MRTSRQLLFGALLASLSVAGCGDILSPGSEGSKLATNRQKWASHGYTTYSFTLRHNCFCVNTGPLRVYVVNDTVIDVRQISDNAKVDPRYVETIPALFDFIEQGLPHAAKLDVTYDSVLGYPSGIVYDINAMVADDEGTYSVSDVAPPIEFVVE